MPSSSISLQDENAGKFIRKPLTMAGPAATPLPSGIEIECRDGECPRWDRDLQVFRDSVFDQTSFLGARLWGAEKLSRMELRRDGRIQSAAQVFIFQLPRVLGGSGVAYVKFGPLWRRVGEQPDVAVYKNACMALMNEYAIRRRLCLTIVPGPDPVHGAEQTRVLRELGFVRQRGITAAHRYMVDVTLDPSEQRKSLSSKWRYNLKKSEKNGMDVAFFTDVAARNAFRELHEDMRTRKNYEEATWVDEFDDLTKVMPAYMQPAVALARHHGKPVAGAVIGCIGDTAIYLFGGSSREGLELRAGYLLQWEIVRKLTEDSNVLWYDLDNDASGNPGLRQFKSGLIGRRGIVYELPGEFEYCVDRRSRCAAGLIQGVRDIRNKAREILAKVRA